MKQTIPACIEILGIIAKYLDPIVPVMKKEDKHFTLLKHAIHSVDHLSSSLAFKNSPRLITFIQMSYLMALSMQGGIFIPALNTITEKDRKCTIIWEGGIKDEFKIGEYDDQFEKFGRYMCYRFFEIKSESGVPTISLKQIKRILEFNVRTLVSISHKIAQVTEKDLPIESLVEADQKDMVFILMSCFPIDDLNAMFLYINQFFPESLIITLASGNRVNVNALFQSPSTDPYYLIDKVRTYYDIYFSNQYPIIKEITKSKTKEYLIDKMKTVAISSQTKQNLKALETDQIQTRLTMYSMMYEVIDNLLKK